MTDPDPVLIPLVTEEATVQKRVVETGRVTVRTVVDQWSDHVRADLMREDVEVTRVAVGREITEMPAVREEGDLVIVPIVEEVLVTEKRLVLREEIHLRRRRQVEHVEQPVTLRTMRAVVDRTDLTPDPDPDPTERNPR